MPRLLASWSRVSRKALRRFRSVISYGRSSNGSLRSDTVDIFSRLSRRLFRPKYSFRNLYTRMDPEHSTAVLLRDKVVLSIEKRGHEQPRRFHTPCERTHQGYWRIMRGIVAPYVALFKS